MFYWLEVLKGLTKPSALELGRRLFNNRSGEEAGRSGERERFGPLKDPEEILKDRFN